MRRDHLSRRTYYRHLDAAHPAFIEAFRAVRQEARIAEASNSRTPDDAGRAVARRHRLVVSAKMGLKVPEKIEESTS